MSPEELENALSTNRPCRRSTRARKRRRDRGGDLSGSGLCKEETYQGCARGAPGRDRRVQPRRGASEEDLQPDRQGYGVREDDHEEDQEVLGHCR